MNTKKVFRLDRDKLVPTAAVAFFVFYLLSFLKITSFDVSNSTDSSWQYALSGLRHASQHLGIDLYFTYGPLFEILPTYIHAYDTVANYIIGIFLFLFIFVVSSIAISRLYFQIPSIVFGIKKELVCSILAVGLFFTLIDVDTSLNILLLLIVTAAHFEKKYLFKILFLLPILLLAYYKFSYFIPVAMLLPVVFVGDLRFRSVVHGLYRAIPAYILLFSIFFIITPGSNLIHFAKYMHYSLVNTAAYSEFMGLPFSNFFFIIMIYILIMACTTGSFFYRIFSQKNLKRSLGSASFSSYVLLGCAFLLVMFIDFKHAVVRNDSHLLSFTPFVFLGVCFVVWNISYVTKVKKILYNASARRLLPYGFVVVVVIFHICISIGLGSSVRNYTDMIGEIIKQTTISSRFNYTAFIDAKNESEKSITLRAKEIAEIRSQMKELPNQDKPVIFYGNTNLYGEVLRQDREVLYPPYIQNYVAYPPSLGDSLYLSFIQQHPDALIYIDEREASIDGRVPSYELNEFFQYLVHNYQVVASDQDNRQYVLERKYNKKAVCTHLSDIKIEDNIQTQLPKIPSLSKDQYIKMKVDSSQNALVSATSVLIKNPVYQMILITPEGQPFKARITKSTLKHGIAVSPLPLSFTDHYMKKPFVMKGFTLLDGFPMSSDYSGVLELCTYK